MIQHRPIRQIAYFVPDVWAAAERHSALFGSGPFYVAEHMELGHSIHRGVDRPLDHTAAVGQWGDLMIEFDQQNNAGPSIFHDMYPEGSGRFGLHHIAVFVDDLATAAEDCENKGFPIAFEASVNGMTYMMADAVATHGHMIEIYPRAPFLLNIYDLVKRSAEGFDGKQLFRSFQP